MAKLTAKQKREQKMLDELRSKHSYLLYELRHKDERITMIASGIGSKKFSVRPGVAIKLVVPEDYVLGQLIVENRKDNERAKAKKAKAKAKKS